MKKLKIFLLHFLVFIIGAIGIGIYVFYRLAHSSNGVDLGGIIVMPAVILVYIVIFGIFCIISLISWFLIVYFRNR